MHHTMILLFPARLPVLGGGPNPGWCSPGVGDEHRQQHPRSLVSFVPLSWSYLPVMRWQDMRASRHRARRGSPRQRLEHRPCGRAAGLPAQPDLPFRGRHHAAARYVPGRLIIQIVSPGFEPRPREPKSLVLPLHHETVNEGGCATLVP